MSNEVRNARLHLAVTQSTKDHLARLAEAEGLSVASYVTAVAEREIADDLRLEACEARLHLALAASTKRRLLHSATAAGVSVGVLLSALIAREVEKDYDFG